MATVPSLALIPSAYKASKVYSILPSNGDGDFTFTRNSSATRFDSNGLIESVGVNVPRLDYSDGNCPSLLLEPQRSNFITYSEDFSQSYWSKISVSVLLNDALSPNGVLNASKIVPDSGTINRYIIYNTFIGTIGQTYTTSFYIKDSNVGDAKFYSRITGSYNNAIINLTTGEISSNTFPTTPSVTDVGNGWWKVSYTEVGAGSVDVPIYIQVGDGWTGNGVDGIYLWGAQLEEGSYPTSYIPTNGSIATRIVETCNNAGNASTFNDSEGVLYFEASALQNGGVNRYVTISNGTSNERLVINYDGNINRLTISAATAIGSVTPIFFTNFTQNQLNKIAIRYSSTDLTLFINGVKEETNTSNASFSPNSLNKLNLSNWNDGLPFFGKVKQLQYFDTALTGTELQELTTL